MKLEYAKNPCWSDANYTMIDLVIKWDEFPDELPFTANKNDCEEHGRLIFNAAMNGEYGPISEYIPPSLPESDPLTPQQKLEAAGLTVEELKKLLGLN